MRERSAEELIVLALAATSFAALAPFAAWRLLDGLYAIAAIDLLGLLSAVAVFVHVWRTRRIDWVAWAFAGVAVVGALAIVRLEGPMGAFLVFPNLLAAFFLLPLRAGIALSAVAMGVLAMLLAPLLTVAQLAKLLVSLGGSMVFAGLFITQMRSHRDRLAERSNTDALTGVGNRRALDVALAEVVRVQARAQSRIALLLIDLDGFKAVNDRLGHTHGDALLVRVADAVRARIRNTDRIFRFGGDEFIVLAPGSDVGAARFLAESLRERIAATAGNDVTASIGIAEYQPDEAADAWLRRADEALYAAKREGRNQVRAALPVTDAPAAPPPASPPRPTLH